MKICFENDFNALRNTVCMMIKNQHKKFCIVTDSNLIKICRMVFAVNCGDIFYFICAPGEVSKSFLTCESIYRFLISNNFSRTDVIMSFGGGVVCDVAGFVASTFMRGICFIQVPTSLLAQVDAGIGGKNAINVCNAKNIVGSFYDPYLIYINFSVLHSLNQKELSNGMSEIIKYSLLDKTIFDCLLNKSIYFDNKCLRNLIIRCVKIKMFFVNKDYYDIGCRRYLNLGHTFAHLFESCCDFKISHGEAVALGMICCVHLSEIKFKINHGILINLIKILNRYKLPVGLNNIYMSEAKIYENLYHDKKISNNRIHVVLLKRIGCPCVCDDVTLQMIFDTINFLNRYAICQDKF
jgi:3-dehydroquinate synthase